MTKLTHRQMTVLSGAAQREDGAAILPNAMNPTSRVSLSQTLMAQDLVREVRTKSKMPIWRRDAAGRPLSLVITRAGKAAIESRKHRATKIDEKQVLGKFSEAPGAPANQRTVHRERRQDVKKKIAPSCKERQGRDSKAATKDQASPPPLAWRPRAGSKQALLISMLMASEGASLDALVAATRWLPHTVRAAVTGLRKRGYAIARLQESGGKTSIYHIVTHAQPIAA
ncbi:MAG TPA: DUF3489 domain-containing protein [Methylocella sp.]